MISRWCILACLILLVGCKGSDAAPKAVAPTGPHPLDIAPGTEAKLFPIKKGNQWTYISEINSGNGPELGEMVWRIADVKTVDGATEAKMQMLTNGKLAEEQTWRLSRNGLYQRAAGKTKFIPVQPIIVFPPKTARQFAYRGSGVTPLGSTGSLDSESKIIGSQEVDTDMGRVTAIAVESIVKFKTGQKDGIAITTTWLQPDVGVVRYRMDIVVGAAKGSTVLRLKSTNVKP